MGFKDTEKRREYHRKWISNRREEFFSDKKCKWCDSTENLVLHHVDPLTKETHRIWSWSKDRRLKELSKCIVLCENCHVTYHSSFQRTAVHGTHSKYAHGCRCVLCRNAQREYQNSYNKRRRDEIGKTYGS